MTYSADEELVTVQESCNWTPTAYGATVFRVEVVGFTETFVRLADINPWIDALRRRYSNIAGASATIYQGQRFGTCDEFCGGRPQRTMVVPG